MAQSKITFKKRAFNSLYSVYKYLSKDDIEPSRFQKSKLFFLLLKEEKLNHLKEWEQMFHYDIKMLLGRKNPKLTYLLISQDEKRLQNLTAEEKTVYRLQ